MYRRQYITAAATTTTAALAGCVFGGSDTMDRELEDGENDSFEASEGDELAVTVNVEDGDSVDVRISYDPESSLEDSADEDAAEDALEGTLSGPILDETVDDESTFDIEIEADGEYEVSVSGGTAQVTIE